MSTRVRTIWSVSLRSLSATQAGNMGGETSIRSQRGHAGKAFRCRSALSSMLRLGACWRTGSGLLTQCVGCIGHNLGLEVEEALEVSTHGVVDRERHNVLQDLVHLQGAHRPARHMKVGQRVQQLSDVGAPLLASKTWQQDGGTAHLLDGIECRVPQKLQPVLN